MQGLQAHTQNRKFMVNEGVKKNHSYTKLPNHFSPTFKNKMIVFS